MPETNGRNEYWIVAYNENPNSSHIHDSEASFTLLSMTNPFLSQGLD